MKTIYLWITNEGWKPFDFDAEQTKSLLKEKNIQIGYSAKIGDSAKIGGSEIILKTIFITGTKHSINWWGKNIINIGCHKKEISWWVKNFKMIGEKEGYSENEIEEYHQYILICQRLQKLIDKK